MSARFLTDLATILRRAGCAVEEVKGWQTRAAGRGGYAAGRPTHVIVHHTASPPSTDGARDLAYILGSPVAPIGNLYLSRTGTFHVVAAGTANTNGVGSSKPWGGGVPDNAMNSYSVAIEAANTGVGEPWPTAQTDAYVRGVAALCLAYGIPVAHVRAHAEWSPGRKIDPAGPSPWAAGRATWNMDGFRTSVAAEMARQTTPDAGPPRPPVQPAPEPWPSFDPARRLWGLYPLATNKPTTSAGSSGDHVRYLQGVLRAKAGQACSITGKWDTATGIAVANVQHFFGVSVDKVVGWHRQKDGTTGKQATWPIIDFLATA